ncbi:serine/threonine protein kinase [Streptomyces incarnatus]|uniref:non-specific serine/threonine protein kinase n=1 Tax=Streptomyces incarnatus TaxID=665007 RepID=A0ABN4GG02_9ACTN|nr:serine/threonine-protein kinase [Streptomyces incarnatus]AKJ11299.1 serine/threonine protein kinase [Streptomyces incarnatus]
MGTEGDVFRVIAGRYRLEARIGRGGMGVVWRAVDQVLGRRVAVKELLPDDSLAEGDARRRRDRTFREARAVAQLRHPHVIVVHDVVEQDERPYLVMELIEGGSLADRIARDGPVDAAEAARIGIALLGAIRTAHEAGVLHRDIKPANVLIESDTGRVVLTDFGIAQVAGATTLTETGSFVGSPEYTAPERMSGLRTGPESDLWSLGALLCTVLSGESPFRRDSLGGILHAVVAAEIRPPAEAEPLLPVVRGLLERDPDRRLGAADAEQMLRTFLETGRTPEAPGTPGAPASGRGHRIGGGRTPRPGAPGNRPQRSRAAGSRLPGSGPVGSRTPGSGAAGGRPSESDEAQGRTAASGADHGRTPGSGAAQDRTADAAGARAPGADAASGRAAWSGADERRTPEGGAGYTPTQQDLPHGGPPSPPTVSGTAAEPAARTSTRGVLVAALLVAALAGAGVSAAALLLHGSGHGGGSPGGTATSPATGTGTSHSARPSPSPTPASPGPSPSGTGPSPSGTIPTASAGSRTAPSGYRTARDPAGFSLAVPDDFTRSPQGERVFYLSPGDTFRLGIKVADPQPGGPQAVMNRSAANGPSTNPGYHDGRVTSTSHDGHPAALWEFTWNGFSAAEGPRHTYDLCWEEAGRMYDVWVSAPVGKVREAREYFDVAVDTFRAGS